jgi:large subunit ribosomal protein L40
MNMNPKDEFLKNLSKKNQQGNSILFYIKNDFSVRKRSSIQLTSDETTHRLMLNRDWAKHKHRQHQQEMTFISRAFKSQENALEQLKIESEQLYEQALKVNKNF